MTADNVTVPREPTEAMVEAMDQAKGGATSIAGVASLHRMQTSIQKNGPRLAEVARAFMEQPNDQT